MKQSYWYFPGDPPVLDLLPYLGALCALLGGVLFLCTFVLVRRWRLPARWIALFLAGLGVVVAIPGLVVIGHRHTSTWEPVRSAIRHYDQVIGEAVREQRLTLPRSSAAFERLRATYLPNDQIVHLAGWERPVKLRMAHGVPPYVGVDFGGGAHAMFDPTTMICTYSD